MAKARVVSSLGTNFGGLVDDLIASAEATTEVCHELKAGAWHAPKNWDGNPLTDIVEKMNKAFDRTQENDFFVDATKQADNPGAVVDLHVSQLQVDAIAIRERAFRRRHLSRCRSVVLAGARSRFHADPTGPYERGLRGAIQDMLVRAQSVPNS